MQSNADLIFMKILGIQMKRALGEWLAKVSARLLKEEESSGPPEKTMRQQLAENGLDAFGRPASNAAAGLSLSMDEVEALNPSTQRLAAQPERQDGVIFTVSFRYEDAEGNPSERSVSVTDIDTMFFYGYCHMRKAYRQFAWDRVQGDMVVGETGELCGADALMARYCG